MNITNAQYFQDNDGNNVVINCEINGEFVSVPMTVGNRHYSEIMRQVEAGTLTIQEAD